MAWRAKLPISMARAAPHLGTLMSVNSPVIGVVGGGQLARMMAAPAVEMGLELRCLAESADVSAVSAIVATTVGDYRDFATLNAFAETVDVLTFDHEHVPTEFLTELVARGVAVRPGPEALIYAQDKVKMRERIDELGLPNPAWRAVSSVAEVVAFGDEIGWPVVAKTPRGGYDGKGVAVLREKNDADAILEWFSSGQVLVEQFVPFERELSAMAARNASGDVAVWPVVHTVQVDGVCDEVYAPAPDLDATVAAAASEAARRIGSSLGIVGTFAVEMFQVGDSFLINELAMRPHNTGHWTQDGCTASQFEQHLRAVADLPLASVSVLGSGTVMKNILGGSNADLASMYASAWAAAPEAKIHNYGKSVRPGRKVGHVNMPISSNLESSLAKVREVVEIIREGKTP